MNEYPCAAQRLNLKGAAYARCTGTMLKVKSEHRGKMAFRCDTCGRVGHWWSMRKLKSDSAQGQTDR